MTTAPSETADRTTPQVDDVAAAMAEVERAMAIIDRAMPSCKFKVSILHRLTLYLADWRFKLGQRTCRGCGTVFHITKYKWTGAASAAMSCRPGVGPVVP